MARVLGETCGFAGILRAMHRPGAVDFVTTWALARALVELQRWRAFHDWFR
jgi:hypothetical protein